MGQMAVHVTNVESIKVAEEIIEDFISLSGNS